MLLAKLKPNRDTVTETNQLSVSLGHEIDLRGDWMDSDTITNSAAAGDFEVPVEGAVCKDRIVVFCNLTFR